MLEASLVLRGMLVGCPLYVGCAVWRRVIIGAVKVEVLHKGDVQIAANNSNVSYSGIVFLVNVLSKDVVGRKGGVLRFPS